MQQRPRLTNLVVRLNITRVTEGRTPTFQLDQGQVLGGPLQVRDNIDHVGHYGLAAAPPKGAYAVAVFNGGDRSNGVVVGTAHPLTRPDDLGAGDACLYDNRGRRVWLTQDGIRIHANGADVTLTGGGTVRLECEALKVTGDIIDNCDTQEKSLKDLRDAYNQHKHAGVTAGGALSGLTDKTVS